MLFILKDIGVNSTLVILFIRSFNTDDERKK